MAWFANSRGALALVWGLWLIPRVLFAMLPVTPTSDAGWYYGQAIALAAGHGYYAANGLPTAFWPPGWPLALAAWFRLVGASGLAVASFNLLAAALSAWLLMRLARHITGSPAAARFALVCLALYPNNAGYIPLALTEVFYTMLLLAGCWLIVSATSGWRTMLAGVVFGLATLVKAQTLLVVPLIFTIALLRQPGWWGHARQHWRAVGLRMATVLAVALVVVSPWTLRNHRQLHHWVLVSTNGGFTLLTGNNDSARGDYTPDDPLVRQIAPLKPDEIAYDAAARRLGAAWIVHHPARFAALAPRKLWRLWAPDGEAQWGIEAGWAGWPAHAWLGHGLRIINQVVYVALIAGMALFAPIELDRRRRARLVRIDWWLLPYAIAAYVSVIAVVFSGQSRFHYPVMPFACLACGALLAHVLDSRVRRHGGG